MSKLDKIIKIINKVVDLLDDEPKQEAKKPLPVFSDYGESIVFNKIHNIIDKQEAFCLNRFNQPEQTSDYYKHWEGALFIIREINKEFTSWYDLMYGKEDETDEWD